MCIYIQCIYFLFSYFFTIVFSLAFLKFKLFSHILFFISILPCFHLLNARPLGRSIVPLIWFIVNKERSLLDLTLLFVLKSLSNPILQGKSLLRLLQFTSALSHSHPCHVSYIYTFTYSFVSSLTSYRQYVVEHLCPIAFVSPLLSWESIHSVQHMSSLNLFYDGGLDIRLPSACFTSFVVIPSVKYLCSCFFMFFSIFLFSKG